MADFSFDQVGVELPSQRDLLRLATAGSVDDGKSTLIGRLLLDTGAVFADQLEEVSRNGSVPDLAALTDGLRAEREQGITIDVAYRFFRTDRRSFILADTPGHERYTRNMFTGASTADVAVLLIDARHGTVIQTRRHLHIVALLGIRHVVACVNKMDLVGWDIEHFLGIERGVRELARRVEIPNVTTIPMSALQGDNVVTRPIERCSYSGPTLLEYLEEVDVETDRDLDRLRLPIQYVARGDGQHNRRFMGRMAAGRLRVGDSVVVLPSGATSTISSLDTMDSSTREAISPMSVAVTLADHLDVGRGDMLVGIDDRPVTAHELESVVCWMSQVPMVPGNRYVLKLATRTVRATVQTIQDRTDPELLTRFADPVALELNDIGNVVLRTSSPILADPYSLNRTTGSFILIDEQSNDTVGAGIIRRARPLDKALEVRRDVTWHPSSIERSERWASLHQRGATVLLTGLPASGKSTIAVALERRLVDEGYCAYLLDGDNIRHGLSDDLGFSVGDRAEHIRRVGQVARLFADCGTVAIVSLIAPLASEREHIRACHVEADLPFYEVFVDTSVDECERRDPKGLYARARAGEITGFTGIDAPYERPNQPDLHIRTAETDVRQAVEEIFEALLAGGRAKFLP